MTPLRTLLVDDNQTFLRTIVSLLSDSAEIEIVGQATSGEEAVRVAPLLGPDLVLMDMAMPGINGLEATRQLKVDSGGPCVAILTAHDDDIYRSAAFAAGADDFIPKHDLVEGIQRLCGSVAR